MKWLLYFLALSAAYGASTSIALDNRSGEQKPASDLIYQGQNINSSQVLRLLEQGVDVSLLDPRISNLYLGRELSTSSNLDLPNVPSLSFEALKVSPTEIFRFYAQEPTGEKLTLTMGLDNHTNILRALFLRKLGYDITPPRLFEEIRLSFKDKTEKLNFLSALTEKTLSSKERWLVDQTDTTVHLRLVIAESSELKNVNLYLPIMGQSRQVERRLFRSLLALYVVTDFKESVESTPWTVGSIFNNYLSLSHPYAEAFSHTTINDIKWIMRKISQVSRATIRNFVEEAKFPESTQALVTEKLLSRINSLNSLTGLESIYEVDLELTDEHTLNGELRNRSFEDSALNYGSEDELSPYRFSELFKLLRTETVYSALSTFLDTGLEKAIPGIYSVDAQKRMAQDIAEFKSSEQATGTLPIKSFTSPTIFGGLFANRNIVFGQVLDTVAPIQLVDSVGVEVNLGVQSRISGLSESILPSLGVNSSLVRTYTHVRAMPDLKTASSQPVTNILVPRLLKRLGRIIQDEYKCSISAEPFVEEKDVAGEAFYTIKYDSAQDDGQAQALRLREKIISEGVPKDKVLMLRIDREQLCTEDVQTIKNKSIEDFLRSFAENETFVISDTLRLNGSLGATIPLALSAQLNLGIDTGKALIHSIFLKKVEDSIQVTVQRQKDHSITSSETLSFYIQILKNSQKLLKGEQENKFYDIQIKPDDQTKKQTALQVIRSLFVSQDQSLLSDNYQANDIHHDVKVKLNTFNLLWFKRERFKMSQDLSIVIPNQEGQEYTLQERTKTFVQAMDYKRKGEDFHSFANSIFRYLSEFITIGQASPDPGKTFKGDSRKVYFTTEIETTPNQKATPTTRVEFIRSGWQRKQRKLQNLIEEVNQLYSKVAHYPVLRKELLQGVSKLKSFDLRTTIILYPSALQRLAELFLISSSQQRDQLFNSISTRPSREGEFSYETQLAEDLRVIYSSDLSHGERAKAVNSFYEKLFRKFDRSKVLALIGADHFFASTRLMGFREDHPDGFLQELGNTVGTYDSELGTGKIDQLASLLGISSFQLRALNYSPGM